MTWFYNYLSGDRKSVALFVSMYVVALEQDTKICQCQLKQWESFFSGGYAEKKGTGRDGESWCILEETEGERGRDYYHFVGKTRW